MDVVMASPPGGCQSHIVSPRDGDPNQAWHAYEDGSEPPFLVLVKTQVDKATSV